MPNWSSERYDVIGIDKNRFLLNRPTKRKPFYVMKLQNDFILKE